MDQALEVLLRDELPAADESADAKSSEEAALEQPMGLDELRRAAVIEALRSRGAESIVDLGCGEGKLLQDLLAEPAFRRVVGMDVAHRALERASRRLRLDDLPARQRERVQLLHGSLVYRDDRLAGFDGAALVEVIEHLDPPRLATLERVVFGHARPRHVVVTTPNVEYNVHFERMTVGRLRHRDHRFEWTRAEFREWAEGVGNRFGYRVSLGGIGNEHSSTGQPTQLAVFSRD